MRSVVPGLVAVAVLVSAAAKAPAIPVLNTAHLSWLRRDVKTAAGPVATWQIYATPVKKGDRQGPYRFVGDEDEGVGCVDDVARAAIVYARVIGKHPEADAPRQARAALDFVLALRAGSGRYYNFIWADGSIHRDGPTSKPGLNWWMARALWGLAEGAKAFRTIDPAYADTLRTAAFDTVAALEQDVRARRGDTRRYGPLSASGLLIDQASDVTAVAMLGLAALQDDRPDPRLKALLGIYGRAIASWAPAAPGTDLDGAHLPSASPTHWHAYGAHMLHALTLAAVHTGDAALLKAARHEADRFVPHLLISGGPIAGFFPAPVPYPQIAYGVEPQVLGLLALAEATGERRYAVTAALFGAWLTGANPANTAMYDPGTGRVFDGIDAKGANADSGAESTIEGLLAIEALGRHPELAAYVHARDDQRVGVRFFEAEAVPGARKQATPGFSQDSGARLLPGERLRMRLSLPKGDYVLTPVVRRDRHLPGEAATLSLAIDGASVHRAVAWPPAGAPWPAPEVLPGQRFRLGAASNLTLRYHEARQPLDLDGVIAQPALEWRTFKTAAGPVAVVANRTGRALTARVPGFPAVSLSAYGTALLDMSHTGKKGSKLTP